MSTSWETKKKKGTKLRFRKVSQEAHSGKVIGTLNWKNEQEWASEG